MPGASEIVAVLKLTPALVQPPPSGALLVFEVDVLPTNAVPPVSLPEIVLTCTDAYVKASLSPTDVVPSFHFTETFAVLGFVYEMSCEQFSASVFSALNVNSPLVIPGVPVQPESVPVAVSVWGSLTVGDTGGDNVSFPANAVHVNPVDPPDGAVVLVVAVVSDDADVVVSGGADFLELLEHAGRIATIAINVRVVTTRFLRTRVTSVPAKMGRAPYIDFFAGGEPA